MLKIQYHIRRQKWGKETLHGEKVKNNNKRGGSDYYFFLRSYMLGVADDYLIYSPSVGSVSFSTWSGLMFSSVGGSLMQRLFLGLPQNIFFETHIYLIIYGSILLLHTGALLKFCVTPKNVVLRLRCEAWGANRNHVRCQDAEMPNVSAAREKGRQQQMVEVGLGPWIHHKTVFFSGCFFDCSAVLACWLCLWLKTTG